MKQIGILLFIFSIFGMTSCVVKERLEAPKVVGDGTGYLFSYEDISASQVNLAGTFNDFTIRQGDRKEIKMTKSGEGLWTVVVPYREFVSDRKYDHLNDDIYLEHGNRYKYKIVIDQNRWITDPTNRSLIKDPDGTENSLLVAP